MKKLIIFPLLLSIITLSCSNDRNKHHGTEYFIDNTGKHISRTYDTSGQLVSEIKYIDSTNGIFLLSKYDKSGMQIDSIPYRDGKIEGVRFQIRNDTLYYSEYKNGIPNGKTFAYSTDKKIIYEGQYLNELPKGEWRFYHSNGKLLTYEYFNSSGVRVFLEKFSPEGNLVSVQGNPLIQGKWNDTISISDNFEAFYEVAHPPVGKVKCYAGDIGKNNKAVNVQECEIVSGAQTNFYDHEAIITYKPKVKGKAAMGIVWQLVNTDSILLSGEIQLNLFVRGYPSI